MGNSKSIIAKKRNPQRAGLFPESKQFGFRGYRSNADWWWIGIICVSFFLRIFRIETLTEFLGDQGRTMLVMRDFLEAGIMPLVGPSTLSGHYLGPVFYYLLVPGYLGGPVGMSIWVALFGVAAVIAMYETARLMFGVWPARLVSLLWAVSPLIVIADRIIWEPNLVPFFAVLYIYLLYRAHLYWRPWVWVALGSVVGILIQIHYPNVFFVGLTGVYLVGCMIFRLKNVTHTLKAVLLWSAGLIVMMVPFFIYEYANGFENIAGVTSIILGSDGLAQGKRAMLGHVVDYAFRVFGQALPFMRLTISPWLISAWVLFIIFRPSKKNLFFSLWFFGGLVSMGKYTEVVYDHYLNFLTPVPFLFIGSVVYSVRNTLWKNVIYGFVILLCVLQLMQTDVFARGNNDIARVEAAVTEIKSIVGPDPFSFTLIGSQSYSDLHYRYYMNALHLNPVSFADTKYQKFMLVCDNEVCPTVNDITTLTQLPILCYEEHCKEFYPKLPLQKEWKYQRDLPLRANGRQLGRLYIFDRQ